MEKLALVPGERINLSGTSVLLVQSNPAEMDILVQIFSGLGARRLRRADGAKAALRMAETTEIDLFVVDSVLQDSDGFDFVRRLRRSTHPSNRLAPVVVVSGHTQKRKVAEARDCGANVVIAKPITPQVLFERLAWITRDQRLFVDAESYVGPDRRFKMLGPPPGMSGRRKDDISDALGAATTPNMSQTDIDAMFRPKRASS